MNRWQRYAILSTLTFVVSAAVMLLNAPGAMASSYADAHLIFKNAAGAKVNVGNFVVTGTGTGSIVNIGSDGWPHSAADFQKSKSFDGSTGDVIISRANGTGLDCQVTTGSGYYDPRFGGWVIRNTSTSEKFTITGLSNPTASGTWSSNTFTVINGANKVVTMVWTPSPPVNGTVRGTKINSSGTSLGSTFNSRITLSGVGNQTANSFYFTNNVPAGSHTLTAETPYKNMTASEVWTSTNGGTSWTKSMSSSATFVVASGRIIDVRVVYKNILAGYGGSLDVASCTQIAGWAENLDVPGSTISVALKVDGGNLVTVQANKTGYGVGNHAFIFATPARLTDGLPHTIDAVLMKTAGGTQQLTNAPRTMAACNRPVSHRIYNMNFLDIARTAVRDNETFPFNLLSYIFPDTGAKGGSDFHLWLSGIYGNGSGFGNSDNSPIARLDAITTINNLAENNCIEGSSALCKNRVPLAYVPQNDGSGRAGSTTPNGNIWMSLRQNNVAGADSKKGGIASNDTANVGGFSGVHLNSDEISKIRVFAGGIQTDATGGSSYGQPVQGLLDGGTATVQLQADARSLNMPSGYQGPNDSGIWDNVRNPNLPGSGFTANLTTNNLDFVTPNANIFNSPGIGAISLATGKQQYLTGTATSLLQDGEGNGYKNNSESLTLTGGVRAVSDVKLKWDEYVDWTQVDDKGHYRPTASGSATGFELGAYTPGRYVTLHYLSGGNVGSPPYRYTVSYYYCYNSTTKVYTYGSTTGSAPGGCTTYYSYPVYDYSTSCQSTGPTYAYNTYGSASWRTPNSQSQFGWLNTQATASGGLPYGQNGQTTTSYFASGGGSSNPSWSNTGNNAYWQDTSITAMQTSGSTTPPAHTSRWIYDTSDPLYTNRMIFSGSNSTSYFNGYTSGGSDSFCYYSGSGSGGSPAGNYSYSQYVDGYYANSRYLYENSSAPTTSYYGLYGSGATFDGSTDGSVLTGWAWVSNKQRVRYENTWSGRSRDLGSRSITGSEAADNLLYGPDFDGSASQPSRGSSMIYNPTISGTYGDIFSGGNISGYFSGNNLTGAYLFANGTISNFSGSGAYGYYFNNPSTRSGTTYGPGAPDALHQIFPNFAATIGNSANAVFSPASTPSNLNKKIYRTTGDLTLSATTFCGGAGTIYVNGNLTITGNLSYCPGSSKADVPSVGFVVRGNITVTAGVTSVVGTFVANGDFTVQSNLTATNRSAATGDSPFTLNGSMIAARYNLLRQLSGATLASGSKTEVFNYDGRVVVSPPPGFNSLSGSVQAVLNEAVPRN